MGEGAKLDRVFDGFIDGTVDFEQFRAVLREELASSPELSGSALQRLDALRRANRMSAAVHSLMSSAIENSSGGDITPSFPKASAASPSIAHEAHLSTDPTPAAPVTEGPPPKVSTPPEVGTVLSGRYRLEALLGRGGMNLVYQAEDLRRAPGDAGSAKVAIKLLAPEYTGRMARRVLEWEASVLSGMSHPGIVRALGFNRDREHPLLVMELLTGERLRGRLVRSHPAPLPMDEAIQVTRELADILAYIHRQGFVHRDLKPANIYINTAGHVSVLDFGLAAPIGGADQVLGPPIRPGTPLYASPEVLSDGCPDPRDDVYSLGCVVYEMLTGRHPWGGLPADEAAHRKLKLARPKGLSKARWVALRDSLAFRAEDRPADAAAFQAAFFPLRRKRWFLPLTAAAVLVAAALGVVFLVLDPEPQPGRPAATPGSPEPALEQRVQPGVEAVQGAVGATEDIEARDDVPAEATAEDPPEGPDEPAPSSVPTIDSEAAPLAESAAPPAPPALAFAASRFTIPKSGVALRLELPRPAGYRGRLRVRWRTVDGSAVNGVHFAGSEQWQLAEAASDAPSIVIFIPIMHNRILGPSRSFLVNLEEVRGGPPVGAPSRAEIVIVDR